MVLDGWLSKCNNCGTVCKRPGVRMFVAFAAAFAYSAQQPEPNFHSSLCPKKFLLQ